MNQESIQRNIDILEAKESLSNKEQKKLKKLKSRQQTGSAFDLAKYKNIIISVMGVGIVTAVIAGLIWYVASQPNLPPTSQQGHIESSPKTHILTEPIPDVIQRHMLEHADGGGPPGVVIQYNCDDYDCDNGLIEALKKLVGDFPQNVYLAPGNYDGKIILTREGEIEILDTLDEEKIRDFIN